MCTALRSCSFDHSNHISVMIGTSVTVNLAATAHGTVAQIVLDGVNVTRLDTYSTADNGCPDTTVSWKSPDLNFGWHDITAMSIQPGSNYYSQGLDDVGFMFFQNFMYVSVHLSCRLAVSGSFMLM